MYEKILRNIYKNNPTLGNNIMFQGPISKSNLILFKRYKDFILKANKINFANKYIEEYNMCDYMINNIATTTIDKQSRWLGYIQRGLIDVNLTTVKSEREFSRNLFHKNYKDMGITIPESINLSDIKEEDK